MADCSKLLVQHTKTLFDSRYERTGRKGERQRKAREGMIGKGRDEGREREVEWEGRYMRGRRRGREKLLTFYSAVHPKNQGLRVPMNRSNGIGKGSGG